MHYKYQKNCSFKYFIICCNALVNGGILQEKRHLNEYKNTNISIMQYRIFYFNCLLQNMDSILADEMKRQLSPDTLLLNFYLIVLLNGNLKILWILKIYDITIHILVFHTMGNFIKLTVKSEINGVIKYYDVAILQIYNDSYVFYEFIFRSRGLLLNARIFKINTSIKHADKIGLSLEAYYQLYGRTVNIIFYLSIVTHFN